MTADSVPTAPDGAAQRPTGDDPAPDQPGDTTVDPGGHDGDRRVTRRRRWFWIGFSVLVLGGLVGALFIPTPYYLLEPGSVRPAEQRIQVEGAESFETDGDVLFTTVMIEQATVGGLVRGALDDAVEVKEEEEVYGGQNRRESQRVNQQRMDLSKLIATKVALEELGVPAEVTAEGARVVELVPASPSKGVLRPGDVIVAVDGKEVRMPNDIGEALASHAPGQTVPVVVERPEKEPTATGVHAAASPEGRRTVRTEVTLGAAEEDPARPVLGVIVDPVDPSIDSPVSIEIDSGDVTGPSAGLAWALAVVDRLTPGSLTGGKDVAVTGEILPDGSVEPIGGILQKLSAVKRAGVKTFIYPSGTSRGEQREMRRLAGDEVELRPVASLTEAIEVLAPGGLRGPELVAGAGG